MEHDTTLPTTSPTSNTRDLHKLPNLDHEACMGCGQTHSYITVQHDDTCRPIALAPDDPWYAHPSGALAEALAAHVPVEPGERVMIKDIITGWAPYDTPR